jgi:hypothetical protein
MTNKTANSNTFKARCCDSCIFIDKVKNFVTNEVADRNPLSFCKLKLYAHGSKIILWTFPSFITLFPGHSIHEKKKN